MIIVTDTHDCDQDVIVLILGALTTWSLLDISLVDYHKLDVGWLQPEIIIFVLTIIIILYRH